MFTEEQQLKLHLVALAEYLQTSLTDAQIKLYSKELLPLGVDSLVLAIHLLKQDTDVWSGRFPLPAKIRSYVQGDLENRANRIVMDVLAAVDDGKQISTLSGEARALARLYGWVNLQNMNIGQRPNYISNMRSMAKTLIAESSLKNSLQINIKEQALLLPEGIEDGSSDANS